MSGFYIGADGKARKVKGGYIGIDGKARKIKKGYIGVNGVARLCWSGIESVFANNSWEEIALACQTGQVPDTWKVGDQKTMTIDGVSYAVDIIGKNHDDYSDGSGKAPLTFQLHDCYKDAYMMNSSATNETGWVTSAMRASHLPKILALMPDDVRGVIKEVQKRTVERGASSSVITTADKLFLLSEVEVFGALTYSQGGEGAQYAYYRNGNSKIKKVNDNTSSWWERSPQGDINDFCLVTLNGTAYHNKANYGYGVSFAFCF